MADQWQSLTNKKLHFARIQLDAWERVEEPGADSFREAFLFHAVSAYKSLIAEILATYGVTVVNLPDLTLALELLKEKGRPSSELEQLKSLEAHPGWLSSLLESHFSVFSSASGTFPQGSEKVETIIPLVDPDDFKIDSVAVARKVLSCLKEQVGYFRNLNFEY